jgi:hypothetical protein
MSKILATVGETVVTMLEMPIGHHAGLLYHPSYFLDGESLVFKIHRPCSIRELTKTDSGDAHTTLG